MRRNKTYFMIVFLVVGLFVLPQVGRAQPKEQGITLGMQVRLDRLASEAEDHSYRVGYNPAMEFSLDELCGLTEPDDWKEQASFRKLGNLQALPPSFDWRAVGLPPVRNQGGCGSCWAFGTMGPLESQIMIQTGTAVDLSEQYLVSCNESGWDCGGGWWAHDYHEWRMPTGELEAGAVLEADFPYVASNATCNSPYDHAYRIDNWAYVPGTENDVDEIKQAIYQYGPVAAAVVVGPAFQGYSEGVFDNDESGSYDINHAIVLVGWDDAYSWGGETHGVWILRNSWGPGWGDGGYMYIAYGTSRVGYSANYIEYLDAPDFRLVTPENASSPSSPPTFSWTGPFDQYLFYSVFHYDLGHWAGYHRFYFLIPDTSYTISSNWWDKVDGSMASYWTVCGQTDGWECAEVRSFTKGESGVPGD
jgi:C1A family cysteine protease